FRPAIFNADSLVLDEPDVAQALTERLECFGAACRRKAAKQPDHRKPLLRACRQRPRCGAAEQRDDLAPLHSITSSASASRLAGTAMPSALAVFRLSTNSNLVGCTTGRSEGFSPASIRPA